MARRRTHAPLNVYLNARLVGQWRRARSGAIEFAYDPDWLGWESALPVSLSLPLREDRYTGDRVNAVFENLLPDNDEVRRQIAARVEATGADAYSLLTEIGRDCVGALQFLPEGIDAGKAGQVTAHPASDEHIAKKIAGLAAAPLGVEEDEDFRISLAGAQEKIAFLWWKDRWHVPEGTTATTHIFKPPIGELPDGIDFSRSVENEYLCMKLTAAMGLPTAGVEIAQFDDKPVLVVERFDRLWRDDGSLIRLPQEDFCQVLGVSPTIKYEPQGGPGMVAIMDKLKGSDVPDRDQALFMKAQIVFWLLGATDGHAKNFSVFLDVGGRFNMTPLYDVVSAQPAVDSGQLRHNRMKMAMAVGNSRHYRIESIVPRHFIETARAGGMIPGITREVFDDVRERAGPAIEEVRAALPAGFPEDLADSIIGGVEARLRLIEREAPTAA